MHVFQEENKNVYNVKGITFEWASRTVFLFFHVQFKMPCKFYNQFKFLIYCITGKMVQWENKLLIQLTHGVTQWFPTRVLQIISVSCNLHYYIVKRNWVLIKPSSVKSIFFSFFSFPNVWILMYHRLIIKTI